MKCKQCGSRRILHFVGKPDDRFACDINGKEHDGYPPDDFPIGSGDGYIEGRLCLDCGQIQGKFPAPAMELEGGPDIEVAAYGVDEEDDDWEDPEDP